MKRAFSNWFLGLKQFATPKQNLRITYQGPQETLKDWLARFGVKVATTEEISDNEALMGARTKQYEA